MVKINKFVVGYLQTNCYLVESDLDKQAVLIDAGGGYNQISNYLIKNDLKLSAILLTHGHFDHMMAVNKFKENFDCKIYIHKDDEEMLDSDINSSMFSGLEVPKTKADIILKGGETLKFGEMSFEVIHTPGHSKGSVIYILNRQIIFCGDTLFFESYGATQFYGGSKEAIKSSIYKIFDLEGDYPLYCGHQKETTLEHERRYNPICIE
jgi:glyoxylase-like metal-dependent hydrolase (beta-lactamase superfamily II)